MENKNPSQGRVMEGFKYKRPEWLEKSFGC